MTNHVLPALAAVVLAPAVATAGGASGTLYWDEFKSRRSSPIGP